MSKSLRFAPPPPMPVGRSAGNKAPKLNRHTAAAAATVSNSGPEARSVTRVTVLTEMSYSN